MLRAAELDIMAAVEDLTPEEARELASSKTSPYNALRHEVPAL